MPYPKNRSRIAASTTLVSGAQLLTAQKGLAHADHGETGHAEQMDSHENGQQPEPPSAVATEPSLAPSKADSDAIPSSEDETALQEMPVS